MSPYILFAIEQWTSILSYLGVFRVRYRAQNFNGWGPFSDVALITAASAPSIPPAPIYDASLSNANNIHFGLVPPTDNGGAEITRYYLYIDFVHATSNFALIYNDSSLSVDIDLTANSLTPGIVYRFKVKAVNKFGPSDFSEETLAAFGTVPNPPSQPIKVEDSSTITTISVSWSKSNDDYGIPILGYQLFMDDGARGPFSLVYDGSK